MKIYNKIVESDREPSNKTDIWLDNGILYYFSKDQWNPIAAVGGGGSNIIGSAPDFNNDFNSDF